MELGRRTLLGAGLAGGLLTGCGTHSEGSSATTTKRVTYGADELQQYATLSRPGGELHGTVVLIHGGYWQPGFHADLMDPMARSFNRLGYATWNIEYRRVGSGGGFPTTLEDVAAAMDRLGEQDLPEPVVLGHSAGGHLAVWAASRTEHTPGGPARGSILAVVSLSGLLDLTTAARSPQAQGPTIGFMLGSPRVAPGHYALGDPTLLVPATCPVFACQATGDQVVPPEQARNYVAADRAAGGEASYVALPGDHLDLIDPHSAAFPAIRGIVARASR